MRWRVEDLEMPENVFEKKLEEQPTEKPRVLHSSDFIPGIVDQRHLSGDLKVVKFGLSADIPDGSSDIKIWFSTDTGVLSMWDGSAWLTTTLT